jgi:hypothetical protein
VVMDRYATLEEVFKREGDWLIRVTAEGQIRLVEHPGCCALDVCGHEPATMHIDCDNVWHRTPSPTAFSCSDCGAS